MSRHRLPASVESAHACKPPGTFATGPGAYAISVIASDAGGNRYVTVQVGPMIMPLPADYAESSAGSKEGAASPRKAASHAVVR
jgi:hypothetical protein